MVCSRLDQIYRSSLLSVLFKNGWGKPEDILRLLTSVHLMKQRDLSLKVYRSDHPVAINKVIKSKTEVRMIGSFISPFTDIMPGYLEGANKVATFMIVLPATWPSKGCRPIVIQLAGTGDQGFKRRKWCLANRLRENGIGSIILTNPFYGSRKPKDQNNSCLNYVQDLIVMGGALMLETAILLHWCERHGFGPLGVHGVSMGGHMASLAASIWPKPISLIPCLSWTSAAPTFTHGVMSSCIPWESLSKQYHNDKRFIEIRDMLKPTIPYHCQPYHSPFEETLLKLSREKVKRTLPLGFNGSSNRFSLLKKGLFKTSKSKKSSENADDESTLMAQSLSVERDPSDVVVSAEESNWTNQSNPDVEKSTFLIGTRLTDWDVQPQDSMLYYETQCFMHELLDSFTHLGHFTPPVDKGLISAVIASNDAYIPRDGVVSMAQLWPGSRIHVISNHGHVRAYVSNALKWNNQFQMAIEESISKQARIYYHEDLLSSSQGELHNH